jgi:hypothetical protein
MNEDHNEVAFSGKLPFVSVVVPVKNEGGYIKSAGLCLAGDFTSRLQAARAQ